MQNNDINYKILHDLPGVHGLYANTRSNLYRVISFYHDLPLKFTEFEVHNQYFLMCV